MAKKAGMSEVKFKVRHNALFLREFTVADMVRATGLKPESVRTELQRMRREGLLTSEPLTEKRRGRGGRPALYKLTSDPEKRLALSRSVRAFYPEPPRPTQPTSRHYLVACRLLDRIADGQYKDAKECEALLQEARDHLEFAWYDEGEPEGLIRAYIDRERARLEYLCGNNETAEALFRQVRETFAATGLHDEIAKIDEYLACIPVRRQLMQLRREALTPRDLVRSALEALRVARVLSLADRPLVALLTELLEHLAAFVRDQAPVETQEEMQPVGERIIGTVKWFNESRGYGFILRDTGEDVLVRFSAIRGTGLRTLKEGDRVELTIEDTPKGLQASDVVSR